MNLHATLAWINRLLWTALVVAVIAVGAAVGLGRHYIGYLEQYREPLLAELTKRSGYQIDVDRLRGEWRGIVPQVELDNLRVTAPGAEQPLLELDRLTLRFGLLHSLRERTPVFHRVAGSGLKVALEEFAPGQWRLRGVRAGSTAGTDPLALLLAVQHARLDDATIDVQLFDGGRAQLGGSLRFERSGSFRRLALDLRVDSGVAEQAASGDDGQSAATPLKALLEVDGNPRRLQQGRVRLYTEFDDLDLTPLLSAAKALGIDLRHGRLDGRAWLSWDDGLLRASGEVDADAIDLAALTGRPMAPLQRVEARFDFEQRDGVRQLWLPALSLQWGGESLQLSQLYLRREIHTADQPPAPLQLALPRLELASLRELLLAGGALAPAQRELLQSLAPAGTLSNLHLQLPLAPGRAADLQLRAALTDIELQPWRDAPGARGLDGYVELGASGGRAVLDSEQLAVSFPKVFEQSLQFARGRADVRWQTAAGRTQVRSGAITLAVDGDAEKAAAEATAQVSLDLAHTPGEIASRMDLLVALRGASVLHRDTFLPNTLNADLLAWLKRAVVAGDLPRGAFIYRGSLRPGDSLNRTAQLHLDIADGELAYQPEWPPLRELSAQLWLDDAQLQVTDIGARLLDHIELEAAEAALAPDPQGGMWLTVVAAGGARDDDLLRLLRETPLRTRVGTQFDNWQWQGPAQFGLGLGLGIGSKRPLQVAVDAELGPGRLRLESLDLNVDRVQGPLSYRTDKGLRSRGLTGALFGKPLRATIDTDGSSAVEVDIRGQLALAALAPRLPPTLATRLKGETDLRVLLNLKPHSSRLRVASSLRGMAIDLPPPYAKPAESKLPLQVDATLAGARSVRASVGDWGVAQLQWPDGSSMLQSGQLHLGSSELASRNPSPGHLLITGTLPPLALDDWRPLRAELVGAGDGLAIQLDRLRSPELRIGDTALRDLLLSGGSSAEGWLLQASADSFDGEVLLPPEGPWRVHLRKLKLPPPSVDQGPSTALQNVDPRTLPAVDLQIDELWRGDELWGSLGLALRPMENGVAARQLRADIREIRFGETGSGAESAATLIWLRDANGDRTWFGGRLSVGDLASVLARWGVTPAIVTERGHLDASVSWAGRPDQYALKQLNGAATLALRKGQLLSAGASAEGAIKLVGIFNVTNLLRRLQLDFSDLYKEGISFDRFDGSFALSNGVIELTKPLAITGPSSRFRVGGVLDLNSEQVDMQLTVTLPLAGNLPWIVALAGGLPAAAGVFVASKVFGDQVDRFSSAVYDITGSWRDPQVQMSHIFDAQRSDEKASPAPARSLMGEKP